MNVKITSLPRRSGSSSPGGVLPKVSAFDCRTNAASSRSDSTVRCACTLRAPAPRSEAIGPPNRVRPRAEQVTQTVPAIRAPLVARTR